MARYRTTIDVPGAADPLFDYLADFSTSQEWDPGVKEASRLDDGPIGIGSSFRLVVSFGPRTLTLTYRTVEFDRPRRFVLEADTGTFSSRDVVTIEPHGDGQRVTYDADLALKGPLRVADPLLRLAFGRIGDKAAAGLRRELNRIAG